jgi:hypothetical protein
MAISGMHVGLITAGLFYALIRIGLTREKAGILLLLFFKQQEQQIRQGQCSRGMNAAFNKSSGDIKSQHEGHPPF